MGNWSEYITCQLLFTLPDQDESDLLHVECGCSLYMCDVLEILMKSRELCVLALQTADSCGQSAQIRCDSLSDVNVLQFLLQESMHVASVIMQLSVMT